VVYVVLAMTAVAALVEVLLVGVTAMAVRTPDLLMPPAKGEMCVPIVLERRTAPFGRHVARLARAPELSVVMIVALVTAITRRWSALRGEPVLVTLLAGGAGVPAHQQELRLAGVVELGRRPLPRWGVARLAVASKTPVVLVFPLVASETRLRSGLESLGRVAVLTVRLAMPPFQPKCGGIVIETHRLPASLRMAVVAGSPQASLMRVLGRMAIAAVHGGIAIPLARYVAVLAPHLRMSAPQRHIGEAMVERLPVERHDVHTAAFMFGMAPLARSIPYGGFVPMKPALPAQILAHLFVTGQAEVVLSRLVKRFVTLVALTLDVRVFLHDLTGNHQRLDPRCLGIRRRPYA
jgi:hypothetical protein